jgi:hypothetical protein
MSVHHLTPTAILADPGSSAGGVLGGIVFLALLIGGVVAYNSFKYKGFRPRSVHTNLSVEQLRTIFVETVSGKGWSIVDDGNPMVAQSGLLAGIRQQVALRTMPIGTGTMVHISVLRYSKKVLGGPTKAYTLRWRMNAFLDAVRQADINATVAG